MTVPREVLDLLRPGIELERYDRRSGDIVALLVRDPKLGLYGWKALELSLDHEVVNRSSRWTTERSANETYDLWERLDWSWRTSEGAQQ